jgi:hypothetical protein
MPRSDCPRPEAGAKSSVKNNANSRIAVGILPRGAAGARICDRGWIFSPLWLRISQVGSERSITCIQKVELF